MQTDQSSPGTPEPVLSRAVLRRISMPASVLCLISAAFIILANNVSLYRALDERLAVFSLNGAAFVFSVYMLLTTALCLVFFLIGHRYTLKPVLIFFAVLSATLSYFGQQLGVVFDVDMIRNIAETIRDNNQQEAFELLSLPLILQVTLLGLLPSLFVVYVKPVHGKPARELLIRLGAIVVMLAVVGLLVWMNFKFTSFFVRENREVRVYTIPTYPIFALEKYAKEHFKGKKATFQPIGEDAAQHRAGGKKVVGLMIVGETARADHLSLNGYERQTNPLLEAEQLLNFSNATSAGTSTAYSVPAMFSFMTPKKYSPEKAAAQSNALDVLKYAGVDVFWIENNSSSKGVANRIETIDLRSDPDPTAPLYSDGGYFDEALVTYLDQCIDAAAGDVLIVMHTMGSHGPTYHKRYPAAQAFFVPDCKSNSPQECSTDEVINAYDNTIRYTDFVVDGLIEYLKNRSDSSDTFLLYASDHGESLGEDGIYLHGLPAVLAPEAQTHVPLFAWISEGYSASHGMVSASVKTNIDAAVSHANLPHTLLGLLNVRTELYQSNLDLFSAFREPASPTYSEGASSRPSPTQ